MVKTAGEIVGGFLAPVNPYDGVTSFTEALILDKLADHFKPNNDGIGTNSWYNTFSAVDISDIGEFSQYKGYDQNLINDLKNEAINFYRVNILS